MEIKPQILAAVSRRFLLLALPLLLPAVAADAAGVAEKTPAPVSATADALEQGQNLQREAASLREQADRRLAEEETQCAQKFMVNDCRNEAKARHLDSVREARRLDAEGREQEYKARLELRAAKQHEREEEAARQAAELPARQDARAAERQQQEAAREKKRAEKEIQARKKAQKREKQAQKQAKHEAAAREKTADAPQ